MSGGLDRSLRVYGIYLPLSRAHFWMPVFFLYFAQGLSIEQILWLEAIYYATVVVFEVPSGYWSDSVSRVGMLRIAALSGTAAFVCFVLGAGSLSLLALGQMLKAVSFSFGSGTETSFHYETLDAEGLADRYPEREARLERRGLLATSLACAVGGAAAWIDLQLAFLLSLLASLGTLFCTFLFVEPPRSREDGQVPGFLRQLSVCARRLRDPVLLWLFAYGVLETTLAHVPYEFAQPYAAHVLGESLRDVGRTPLVTGLLYAVVALFGAFAAGASLRLARSIGVTTALLAVTLLQTLMIGSMAFFSSSAVLILLSFRSVYPAVGRVLARAMVTPRVPRTERATYWSVASLAGRLGFALVLFLLGALAPEGSEIAAMTSMLRAMTALAILGFLVFLVTRGRVARDAEVRALEGPER